MAADTAFEELVDSVDPPMFVVTAAADGERSGCLVGFATQASVRPARFIVMLSKENHTYGVAVQAPVLVVHVLRESDSPLAELFGSLSGDDVDKFADIEVVDGPGQAPVIVGVDWFAGRVIRHFDCGDHVAFLLAPHEGSSLRTGERQFGLRDAVEIEPGHSA